MKIVLAPDSFKESMTAVQAAEAMKRGFAKVFPDAEYVCVPMADGGEGTAQTLVSALSGEWVRLAVQDPLGRPVEARYGVLPGGRAIIEMAEAAGIYRVSADERNPMLTSTFGVGQMVRDAVGRGIRHIILGLGGSATNDGGAGLLQALGFRLLRADGTELPPGGAALADLAAVLPPADDGLAGCVFEAACDVRHPLCGPEGASAVFGPQKGATPEQVALLDKALAHYADVLAQGGWPDSRQQAGSGAAGGLGFALRTVLGAELKPGIEMVVQTVGLAEALHGADLAVTGEGRMDGQTAFGKVPSGVLAVASQQKIPVVAIAGGLGEGAGSLHALGFRAVFPSVAAPQPLADVLAAGEQNVERTAEQIARLLALGKTLA